MERLKGVARVPYDGPQSALKPSALTIPPYSPISQCRACADQIIGVKSGSIRWAAPPFITGSR